MEREKVCLVHTDVRSHDDERGLVIGLLCWIGMDLCDLGREGKKGEICGDFEQKGSKARKREGGEHR